LKDKIALGQNQPNPAKLKVYIPLEIPSNITGDYVLRIVNVLGQEKASFAVGKNAVGVEIEVEDWDEGVYFYQLVSDDYQSNPLKMVVTK